MEFILDFHAPLGLGFDATDANGDGLPDAVTFNPDGTPDLDHFAVTLLNPATAAVDQALSIEVAALDGGDRTLPPGRLMTVSFIVLQRTLSSELQIEPLEVRAFDLEGTVYPVIVIPGVVHVDPAATPNTEPTHPVPRGYDDDGCVITARHSSPLKPILVLAALLMVRALSRRRSHRD